MNAVLDRKEVDALEKTVREFEQRNGEVLEDGDVPEVYDCKGDCWGGCKEQVAKDPKRGNRTS